MCAASLVVIAEEALREENCKGSIQGGGSLALVQQLENGAEADLLLLADAGLLEQLKPGRVADSRIFAGNRLTLMTRKKGAESAETLLKRPELTLAVADPQAAPLGRYTEEALSQFQVRNRRVPLKDASGVVAALKSGHADLAVLYQTDSKRLQNAVVVTVLPAESHSPVHYLAVLLKPKKREAGKLFDFLTSARATPILEKHGFIEPAPQ